MDHEKLIKLTKEASKSNKKVNNLLDSDFAIWILLSLSLGPKVIILSDF
jgi:hypothetical protein